MVVIAPQRAAPYGACRLRRCVYVSDVASRRERRFCGGAKKVNVGSDGRVRSIRTVRPFFILVALLCFPRPAKSEGARLHSRARNSLGLTGSPTVRSSLELRE